MVQTCPKVSIEPIIDGYPILLGISSDHLCVFDEGVNNIIETICQGNDTDAYLVQCKDEDDFLDTIIYVKLLISKGIDVKKWVEQQQ